MKNIYKFLFIFFLTLSFLNNATAQENTFYFMDNVPQSLNNNPAKNPKCKFFFGILSDTYFEIVNTGFKFNSFFKYIPDEDVYIPDIDGFYENLKKRNSFYVNTQATFLQFGFRAGESYFTFSFKNKMNQRFDYPKGIFKLKDGTYYGDGSPVELGGFGENLMVYNELSFGYSRNITPNLRVGARANYLIGLANIQTKKLDINWYTDPDMYDYRFETDIELRATFPVDFELVEDEDGLISDVEYNEDHFDIEGYQDVKKFISPKNRGWGIDLGATYKLFDVFEFSASIIDFGFIRWKEHPKTMKQSGSLTFSGIELDFSEDSDNQDQFDQAIEELTDSALAMIEPELDENTYTTMLNTKIFLAASYTPIKWWTAGLLIRNAFYNKGWHPSLTLSSNINFARASTFTLSYSFINRSTALGLGLAWRIGPMQTYMVFEQLSPAFWALNGSKMADRWIRNTNMFTFHFGVNWAFGCKKKIDYGLIEE